jgi:hypothetical protein
VLPQVRHQHRTLPHRVPPHPVLSVLGRLHYRISISSHESTE